MSEFMQMLYTSELAPEVSPACVGDIVRDARTRNARLALTGVLLFDGLYFCQYLEGPGKHLVPMVESIRNDPRHIEFNLHYLGPLEGDRRFNDWSIGYASMAEQTLSHLFDGISGIDSVLTLRRLVPTLDIMPGA